METRCWGEFSHKVKTGPDLAERPVNFLVQHAGDFCVLILAKTPESQRCIPTKLYLGPFAVTLS